MMSALSDYFASLAAKIRSKTGKQTTMSPNDMVDEVDVVYSTGKTEGITETKVGTAVASDVLSGKTFTNSSGVGINGTLVTQSKTAELTYADATISPDSGKLLSSVSVKGLINAIDNSNIVTVNTTSSSGYAWTNEFSAGAWLIILPTNRIASVSGLNTIYNTQSNLYISTNSDASSKANVQLMIMTSSGTGKIYFGTPATGQNKALTYFAYKLSD